MKKSTYVYLAIDNQILLRGFEGLIKSQLENVTVNPVNSINELFEVNFHKDPEVSKIIIYDSSIENEQTNLLLFNLLQTNPDLRILFLIKEFDQRKIKFLFNVGIYGVLSKDISVDDFSDILNDVLLEKRSLCPSFREQLIKKFCQRDQNLSQMHGYEEVGVSTEVEDDYMNQLFGLTKREKEILCLICNGKNTKEISEELFISLHTAETHRRNLLSKLDVKNTAEMVKVALMSKLITP